MQLHDWPASMQVRAELFDWNSHACHGDFDVALACDVLYEHYSVEPVANIAPQLLKQQAGRLLLADPSKRTIENRYIWTSCTSLMHFVLRYVGLSTSAGEALNLATPWADTWILRSVQKQFCALRLSDACSKMHAGHKSLLCDDLM